MTEEDAKILKEYFHGFEYKGAGLHPSCQLYLAEYPLSVLGGYRRLSLHGEAPTA